MKLFGQVVRTVVNVVALPVAIAKDVVTLGGAATGESSATVQAVQKIKDEASE